MKPEEWKAMDERIAALERYRQDRASNKARPMTGIFNTLTPEQKKAVLENRDVDI